MRTTFLALGFLALLPSRALAQLEAQAPVTTPGTPTAITTTPGSSQTIDETRRLYRVHLGPLYMNPGLLLKELGVDTNVFNAAGDQKSDFTFTITPKADVALAFGHRGLLRTTAALDMVYYATYASERSLDPQITVRGEAYATRLTFFAQGAYLNTRQRPNYEIDLRSRHVESDADAGVAVRATTKLTVELSANAQTIRYDADAFFLGTSLRDTLNRDETGYSIVARDRLTSLTTLALRYDNVHDAFPYSPVRDNDSFRVMPGVEFKPKALIHGSAYVGYRKLSPKNELLPEYSGLVSQLTLAYTLLGSTMFGVTYDRDIDYSYEAANPYYLDNSLGLFIRRAVGGRFDVILSAARHRYDYRDLQLALPTPVEARVDRTDEFGANFGYRMKGDTRVGFGGTYYTRHSTRETFRQYDGLRAGLTVTYGF
jgi:Flp pilus assembly protein TadG